MELKYDFDNYTYSICSVLYPTLCRFRCPHLCRKRAVWPYIGGWSCLEEAYSISQMKPQLDATLCRFYFCRVTLHVSGASFHHQEYLKLVRWPLVHVLSLQVSHHISLLGPELKHTACSSKTLARIHLPTRRHIPTS